MKHAFPLVLLLAAAPALGGEAGTRSISQGRGSVAIQNLKTCPSGFVRPSPVGQVRASDGTTWTVPAENHFANGPKAGDLYNPCSGVTPSRFADVKLDSIPVVDVDADGETITGYIMADNYYELYVNGKLVAVDPVPFTPFNSTIVRFKAKRPITYAVLAVDWEEHSGLGTESGGHHPGDAGFVARFSDGTVSDASWKAQSFYIAPLMSPNDVIERGNVHDSSKLGRSYPDANSQAACGERCYALHYPVAANWFAKDFDDSSWPAANVFPQDEVGGGAAYTRFRDAFGDAAFIWTNNLVYDNRVILRKTAR